MIFVGEKTIDKTLDLLGEDASKIEKAVEKVLQRYPALEEYAEQENFLVLTGEERAILHYCILVIVEASMAALGNDVRIDAQNLEKAAEANWEVRSLAESKKFDQVIDSYFEGYKQEDLLAFVEDTLVQDEDSPVSAIGREVIFISCKAVIDTLDHLN